MVLAPKMWKDDLMKQAKKALLALIFGWEPTSHKIFAVIDDSGGRVQGSDRE